MHTKPRGRPPKAKAKTKAKAKPKPAIDQAEAPAHFKGATAKVSAGQVEGPDRGFEKIIRMADMAAMLNISRRGFQDMVEAGCPVVDRGGTGKPMLVEVTAVLAWVRARDRKGESLKMTQGAEQALDARRRNAEAQAELREHELARIRGETVLVSEVRPILREELGAVRARLLQIAGRVAPRLAEGGLSIQEIEAEIDAEVVEALTELTLDTRDLVRQT